MELFTKAKTLVKRLVYSIPVLLTAILCYGFAASHITVSIDDLQRSAYVGTGNIMIASTRFMQTVWSQLLSFTEFYPYAEEVLAVVILLLSAVVFCLVFQAVSGDKLPLVCYTLFSCLFISYPLIHEIWEYSGADVIVCINYLLVALAGYFAYADRASGSRRYFLLSAALLMMAVSAYQTAACVYLVLICIILFMRALFGTEEERKLRRILLSGIGYLIPLAIGICAMYGIHFVINALAGLPDAGAGAVSIVYFSKGFLASLQAMAEGLIKKYFLYSLWSLPIAVLVCAEAAALIGALVISIRKRRWCYVLLAVAAILSLYMISFIQGLAQYYRISQAISLFVATVLMLLVYAVLSARIHVFFQRALLVLGALLCLTQCMTLNKYFALNHLRSEEEAAVVRSIGYTLKKEYDPERPVVFVGEYEISPGILTNAYANTNGFRYRLYCGVCDLLGFDTSSIPRYVENTLSSVINQGIQGWEQQSSMKDLFDYYGYRYVSLGEWAQQTGEDYHAVYKEAEDHARANMEVWPRNGSIYDNGQYIIVSFSFQWLN